MVSQNFSFSGRYSRNACPRSQRATRLNTWIDGLFGKWCILVVACTLCRSPSSAYYLSQIVLTCLPALSADWHGHISILAFRWTDILHRCAFWTIGQVLINCQYQQTYTKYRFKQIKYSKTGLNELKNLLGNIESPISSVFKNIPKNLFLISCDGPITRDLFILFLNCMFIFI